MKTIPAAGHPPLPASQGNASAAPAAHGSDLLPLPLRPHHAGAAHAGHGRSKSLDERSSQTQELRQQIVDLSDRVEQAERALDDTATQEGRLSDGLRKHMRAQWKHEHQLNSEFFTAGSYASLRRRQLARLPGGEVASAQFGLSFADDMASVEPQFTRLKVVHNANGGYQRIAPGPDFRRMCDDLYLRKYPGDHAPRLFTNSMFMANKLRNDLLGTARPGDIGVINSKPVAPGIVALRCEKLDDAETLTRMLAKLGGRPSAYQVVRCAVAANGGITDMVNDPRVSVQDALNDLQGRAGQGAAAQLRRVPVELGTAALAHTAAAMIDDLCHVLSREENMAVHGHNPLVARSLDALIDLADAMPAMSRDSARFGNAYRAMMEEMQVILGSVRPWQPNDFKRAAMGRLDQAISPAMKKLLTKPEPCLTTSGMQALTSAIDLARVQANFGEVKPLSHGDKTSPFYYEADGIVGNIRVPENDRAGRDTVFYASLTDSVISAPGEKTAGWGVQDIASGIKAQLAARTAEQGPLNLVIDTTIEKGDDLKNLMSKVAPDVASNKLRLFLCKSHQKFANLSAAKATGGSLTMVAAGTPQNMAILERMQEDEHRQGWHLNDETQLLTHITRAAQSREPALLQNAVDNGNFVVEHCFNGQDGHASFAAHDDDKPFAMVNNFIGSAEGRWGGLHFAHADGEVTVPVRPHHQLDRDYFRTRGSFGFSESTISTIGALPGYSDDLWRLSFGQETKPELIERFWMASRLLQLDQPKFDAHQAHDLIHKLVADALSPAQQRALRNQPLGEKLKTIASDQAATLSDDQRLDADVSELRGTLASPPQYTMNKIASVLGQFSMLLTSENMHEKMALSPDREKLQGLIDSVLDSGMAGISRLGREQIVRMQNGFSLEDMYAKDAETRRAGVDSLLKTLEKSGISPSLGIFDHGIPDITWQQLPETQKTRLMNAIFRPLDTQAKLEFLKLNFTGSSSHQFLGECASELAARLDGDNRSGGRENWQATLTEEMLRRQIIAPGQPLIPPRAAD